MSKLSNAFKAFAQALLNTQEAIPGNRLVDVVEHMAENYETPPAAWSSGTSEPSGGENGDFYFKTDTGDVYKKAAGGWEVIANLTGDDGTNGTDGLSVAAIELTVDSEGAVTGGMATLSDDSEVQITVTLEQGN